jgi:hypothetical protein
LDERLKGDRIPAVDHLALHCQPQRGMEISKEGQPVAITREAFRVDDDGISTNWVEYNGEDLASACLMIAQARKVRPNHRVATFNVGEAMETGKAHGKTVVAVHDPIDNVNPGHALLTGVAATDTALLDEIAMSAQIAEFPAAAITASRAKHGK